MASLLPPSRALSRLSQLGGIPRSAANPWSRVTFNNTSCLSALLQFTASTPILRQRLLRTFASKPGKPKAHTGRATASKRKPVIASSDDAAGTPKKAAAKKAPTNKAPAKRRTAAKRPAAKKPARNAKSKTKSKPPPKRKVLTEKQKAAKEKKLVVQKAKDLKKTALLDVPKRLPATAFIVLHTESSAKGMKGTDLLKNASAQYKNLSPEEMERLNHVANENKAKNDVAFKNWLQEHTPAEIKAANIARAELRRKAKEAGKKTMFRKLQDERVVKQARRSYNYFLSERVASGDMKSLTISEIGGLVGREWRALSPAEKKPFDDKAAADKVRYIEECTTVYGKPPLVATRKAKGAS